MSDAATHRILIVDDEPLFLRATAALLQDAGFDCACAADGQRARELLTHEPFDVILSDLKMPGNHELEFLREGRQRWPHTPLIVVTGAPSLPTAIESVRLGVADYLLKPVKYPDLLASVRRVLEYRRSAARTAARPTVARGGQSHEIIGASPAMREVFDILDRIAQSDANVLITGESGTGKEVVAREIHRRGPRAAGPFHVIDCTAIPETLFESVLFGHAKGAFTGAVRDQLGLLSQADGGTAFLDEIGELAPPLQAKLLRVIQEPTFTPLGRSTPERVDVRFICATNRPLELEVEAGRFRRDLYYRLAVIHFDLPPLRDRGGDVMLLARHFLRQLKRPDQAIDDFSPECQALLSRYTWPGNVRELRNAVERGLALARDSEILPGDLPALVQQADPESRLSAASGPAPAPAPPTSREHALREAEREYLIGLLRQHSGNVARSARSAGLSRQGLHKLLKHHGIAAGQFRP